jgi:ADP-heptose:LPS heptosyltransferase
VGDRHAAVWAKPACAPCFLSGCPIDHRCMEAIGVDEVLTAVLERLGARP